MQRRHRTFNICEWPVFVRDVTFIENIFGIRHMLPLPVYKDLAETAGYVRHVSHLGRKSKSQIPCLVTAT